MMAQGMVRRMRLNDFKGADFRCQHRLSGSCNHHWICHYNTDEQCSPSSRLMCAGGGGAGVEAGKRRPRAAVDNIDGM